jgi:lysophospholipase L1-like esterase
MKKTARERHFAIVATLLGILVALLVAEAGMRLGGLEYTVYPTRFQFGWPDSRTLETDFVLDPQIQWKPREYDSELQAARGQRIDVIHMGDSCTQLGQYRMKLLEQVKAHNPDLPFNSLNLAVAGWSSYQGLQQMQRDITQLKPRIVTLYYGWNDHWLSFGIPDKDMDFSQASNRSWRALQRLRVFQLIAWVYNERFILKGNPDHRPLRVSPDDYRYNLTQMVQLARTHGITPVLLTAPSAHVAGQEPAYLQDRFINDLTTVLPLHRQYNDIVRDVARQENVLLLDLASRFESMPAATVRDQYMMYDGIHWRPEGSEKVAELLYVFLQEQGLISRPPHAASADFTETR